MPNLLILYFIVAAFVFGYLIGRSNLRIMRKLERGFVSFFAFLFGVTWPVWGSYRAYIWAKDYRRTAKLAKAA